jgi:tetratricopeptide (TPR) repeat protein
LLGRHPGADFCLTAAASVLGQPIATTRRQLRELCDAHLLTEHVPNRYAFHDLLRAYAARRSSTMDSDMDRNAALRRMLDHYLHTASRASALYYPQRTPIALDEPQPGVTLTPMADLDEAVDWLTAERVTLASAVHFAAEHGFPRHCWQLAWAMATYQKRSGHLHEQATVQRIALAAGEQLADHEAMYHAHRNLAVATSHLGMYEDANTHLAATLDLAGEVDGKRGQGHAHIHFSAALLRQQRYEDALEHALLARELYASIGLLAGEAEALNGIGWCYAMLGDYAATLRFCEQALVIHVKLGPRTLEADTLDSIGYAHHHLGDHAKAVDCYQRALAIDRELGDRNKQAEVLGHLGDVHLATGEIGLARQSWREGLVILEAIGSANADKLRAKLAGLLR